MMRWRAVAGGCHLRAGGRADLGMIACLGRVARMPAFSFSPCLRDFY